MTFPHCSALSAFLIPVNETITSNLRVLTASVFLLAIISTLTIVSNTTVILAVLKSWFTDYYKITSHDNISPQILILSMAAIGLLYGLLVMPIGVLEVVHNGEWPLGAGICRVRHACNQLLSNSFMMHVMCLSIDRYMAICKPLKYRVLTYKTGLIMTAVAWFLASLSTVATQCVLESQADVIARLLNTSSMVKPEYTILTDKTFILTDYLIGNSPFIFSDFLYGFILLEVHRYQKRTHERSKPQNVDVSLNSTMESKSKNGKQGAVLTRPKKRSQCLGYHVTVITEAHAPLPPTADRKHGAGRNVSHGRPRILKAFRTVGFITICYTLCWLPSLLYLTRMLDQGRGYQLWSEVLVLWVTYINSALNPIFYCTYKPVSRAMTSLFKA